MFVMLSLAHYGHNKPRLAAQRQRLEHVLSSDRRCLEITRLTHAELMQLADILGIDTDEQPTGNWRFSALHRLVIALYCLSAQQCLRRAKQQWGWAVNSISSNTDAMCELIIEKLDAPGSRTCSSCACLSAPALSVCSRVCLLAQLMLSGDGRWRSRMHGLRRRAALLSSTTASASWTRLT